MQGTLGIVYFIAGAERVEAVPFTREHFARHRQAIGDFAEGFRFGNAAVQLAELVIHKADIKRRVVNDQFGTADIVHEFICHIGKRGLVHQELIGNAVNHKGFRIDKPIGFEIDVKIVAGEAAVNDLYGTNLNDLVPFIVGTNLVHTGGFGIENDLSGNSSVNRGHLCQTYRLRVDSITGSLPEMLKQVEIFTDGSCLGNPGPGGYGAILRYRGHEKTFSQGYRLTTNNRMELMAAIVSLEALKEQCEIVLSTDSQYVRQGITQWIHGWKKRGWKTADKKPVKNVDLWQRLDAALGQHKIRWEWVKGHAGHPENERCDELARAAAIAPSEEDVGYKPEG